jgi:hypothetical protein
MHSYRVLGVIALSAVVLAVISFTVVDITIDSANGCLAARGTCTEHEVPPAALGYAVIGAVALLASIVPMTGWVVGMLRRPAPPAEPLPRRALAPLLMEDEL